MLPDLKELMQTVMTALVVTMFVYILLVILSAMGIKVCVSCSNPNMALEMSGAAIATAPIEGFHDYGGTQRRYVSRTDVGADDRDLANRQADQIQQEGLVGNRGVAPAFHDGGMYNLEGTVKNGVLSGDRAAIEEFDEDAAVHGETFKEHLDDGDLAAASM